ncbi:MAG: sulfatase family protein, partial [Akkermansiaceae bacterium]
DWGWPHSDLYGDQVVKTPHFNRIANSGILFEHAYISAPSCTPSRNAILTGQYHWQLGGGANLWSAYPEGHVSFPRHLEKHGYFIGSYRKSFGPGKDLKQPVAGKRFKSPEAFFAARPKHQPFCFWFGASDPHRGYAKGSGKRSGMDLSKIQVPPMFPDNQEVRSDIADYYFEVQRFDRDVGKVLKMLETSGDLANTLIIMTGDHGWPFPRGKSNLYDLGTRVPLAIMWGDGLKKPKRKCSDFVSLIDIAATIYDVTKVTPPAKTPGHSLLPLLQNSPNFTGRKFILTGKERHTPCQESTMQGYPCRAIRNHQYLYIKNIQPNLWPAGAPKGKFRGYYGDIDNGPTKTSIIAGRNTTKGKKFFTWSCGKRPAEELYDCAQDPFQLHNLADQPNHTTTLKNLRIQLDKELQKTGDLRTLNPGNEYVEAQYLGRIGKDKNRTTP